MEESWEDFRIQKLKGTENWTMWYEDIKCFLIIKDLWDYACGVELEPVIPIPPSLTAGSSSRPTIEAAAQEKYDENVVVYQADTKVWLRSHQKTMAYMKLACESGPRAHLIDVTNAHTAIGILRNLYEKRNLFAIDISYREITRSNLENFVSIEAYAHHLKAHREIIIQAGKNLKDWQMSSAFRMGLPARLHPYVFQLLHTAQSAGKVLTMDEMVAALVAEEKRTHYKENNEDAIA